MIDIHSHVLPTIDDGARTLKETLTMVEEAKEVGFTDIITTSHFIDGKYDIDKKDREILINELTDLTSPNVKLHNGAEAYIMPELTSFYDKKTIPTLADSRYVLFELPLNSDVLYADKVILDLVNHGYTPIIAHPERYKTVQKDINRAYNFIDKGALLQCNFGSFNGQYGREAQRVAVGLLKKDKISFLGSDAHRGNSIYLRIEEIITKLEKTVGTEKVEQLTVTNPQKILNDEYID